MTTAELTATIQTVLESTDPSLNMTEERADEIRDAIIEADLADDAALTAYDLLHARAIFGRAF